MPTRYHVLLNARAGTALARGTSREEVERLFGDAGLEVSVDDETHRPMVERLERVRRSEAQVIVAAGGDGTVTAVAGAVLGSQKLLAILPLGTVNALARDMSIPLVPSEWIGMLGQMQPRRIDVGEVNGQIFLHKVVIGFVPALAAAREQVRGGGIGAKAAFLGFIFRRLLRSHRMAVEISDAGGAARISRVIALAVANNEYDEAPGRLFARSRFDEGRLYIYRLKHLSPLDFVRLAAGMLVGRWRDDEAVEIDAATELILRTRKKTLKVMLDGEVESLSVPLRFRILPQSLPVLGPASAASPPMTKASPA